MFYDPLHNPFLVVLNNDRKCSLFQQSLQQRLDCIRFNISNRLNTIARFNVMSVADSFIVINAIT